VAAVKTLLAVSAIAAFLLSAPAKAADLPGYEAPPAPVAVPSWAGFYAGLNAGYRWKDNSQVIVVSSFIPGSQTPFSPDYGTYTGNQSAAGATGANSIHTGGFIGGVQFGYNFEVKNRNVFGVEADFQGVAGGSRRGSSSSVTPLLGAFRTTNPLIFNEYDPGELFATSLYSEKRTDYLGTIRGRLGWLATPSLLIYGTGGLAYGGVSSSTSVIQTNNDLAFAGGGPGLVGLSQSLGSYSRTLIGWTAGGGSEWIFLPNWSAKLEYLYYDLESVDYVLSQLVTACGLGPPVQAIVAPHASTRFDGQIVRIGLNYHFN
jgi:outer membrane immunogenic protein